jgi:hypothetical protein
MGPGRRQRERPVEDWEFPLSSDLERLAAGGVPDRLAGQSPPSGTGGCGDAVGFGLPDPADADTGPHTSGPGWSTGMWPRARAQLRRELVGSGDHAEPDCLAFPAATRRIHRRRLPAVACTPAQVVALGGSRLLLWTELLGVGAEIPLARLCALDRFDPGGAGLSGGASLTLLAPGRELTLRYHPLGGDLVRPFAERIWGRAHPHGPADDPADDPAADRARVEAVGGAGPARSPWPLPRVPFALTVTPGELRLRYGARRILVDRTRVRMELCDRRELLIGVGEEIIGLPVPAGLRERVRTALDRVPPGGGGRRAR